MLLERDGELELLETALGRAARGAGSVVLVAGEAIGKTSLVRAFLRTAAHRATVLQGACDLLTPRPLGPLRDAARSHGGPLAAALAEGDRDAVLTAVLTELRGRRPTVRVLEDVHWADDAPRRPALRRPPGRRTRRRGRGHLPRRRGRARPAARAVRARRPVRASPRARPPEKLGVPGRHGHQPRPPLAATPR